jgi:sigma-B regulation protein RsbU (phosphoserine phosphatase)
MKDMTETLRRREQEVELRLAAQVQQRLYPQEPPHVAGWDFAGLVLPAEATCGDYYDFIEMGNGHVGLAIGDVCGHGLGPALVMSEVRALLRSGAAESSDAAELLSRANTILTADLEDDNFVTLMMATVETKARRLEWVNAGHPSGYVLAADGSVKAELKSQTVPLGILPELGIGRPDSVELDRGDLILLLTDGVTERGEEEARGFGPEGALRVLRELRNRPAAEIAGGLVDAVLEFSDEPPADDVTVIVVRVG